MSLEDKLRGHATEIADYDGAASAVAYGEVGREVAALAQGAAVFDLSRRRYLRAIGEERAAFLHGQLSNDIRGLGPGDGCASLLLTNQGRVLAILSVYNTGDGDDADGCDGALMLGTDAASLAATREGLARYLVADDCEFEDAACGVTLGLAGPRAIETLAGLVTDPDALRPGWSFVRTKLSSAAGDAAGTDVVILGRDDLRVPAFDLLVAANATATVAQGVAEVLWNALEAAGAVAVGTAALETLRVQSGTARYGTDVDEARIAIEARLEWAIHFNKGCYVGQEVVERAVSRGRLNRRLCLLALDGETAPGDMVAGGKIGETLTSVVAASSDGVGTALALGYVGIKHAAEGTQIAIATATGEVTARVLAWPRTEPAAGL